MRPVFFLPLSILSIGDLILLGLQVQCDQERSLALCFLLLTQSQPHRLPFTACSPSSSSSSTHPLLLLNLPALSHQGNHFISWKLGEEYGWWCRGGGQPRLLILNNYIVRVFVQADVQEPTPLSVISSCYLKINQRKAEEFNYTCRREREKTFSLLYNVNTVNWGVGGILHGLLQSVGCILSVKKTA